MVSRSLTSPGPDLTRTKTESEILALRNLDRAVVERILYLDTLFNRTMGFEVVPNPSTSKWAPGFRAMPLTPLNLQALQRTKLEREGDISAEEDLLLSLERDLRLLNSDAIKGKDAAFVNLYLKSLLLTVVLSRKLSPPLSSEPTLSGSDVVNSCLTRLSELCPQFYQEEIPENTDENIARITQLVLCKLYMSPILAPHRDLEAYLRLARPRTSPIQTFLGQCLLSSETFFNKQFSFLPRETKERLVKVVSDGFNKMLTKPGTSLEEDYKTLVLSAEAVLETKPPAPTSRLLVELAAANLVSVRQAFAALKEEIVPLCSLCREWLSREKKPLEDPLVLLLLRSV